MNSAHVSPLAIDIEETAGPRYSIGSTGPERRRYARIDTSLKAKIYSDYQYADCDILDLSENGARIKPLSVVVPRAVSLQIPQVGTVAGRVVWRRRGQIGVQFRDPDDKVVQSVSTYLNKVQPLH